MTEKTRLCPYCGEEILETDVKCPHCGTRFEFLKTDSASTAKSVFENASPSTPSETVPTGDGELPYFKKMGTGLMILLVIVTLGIYYYYWLIKNTNIFNKIATDNEKINTMFPILYVVLSVVYAFAYLAENYTLSTLLVIPTWALLLITIYKMLRIIESYAYRTTGKTIRHHAFGWWFFNILYANFAINTYAERIRNSR